MEPNVIVIVGPTCSGKTALGILLARALNTEIISADSRQIYKYLDIGTAKPTETELKAVKHHFINILEPDDVYDVSQFEIDALNVINKLHEKGRTPIVVGGSGLYVKALIDGIFDSADKDEKLREELSQKKVQYGNEYLYDELKRVDPVTASGMLPQNWKRVIRALEVFYLTGVSIREHHLKHERAINIKFFQFGLNWQRENLYVNIEKRVDYMIDTGLVEEVKHLLERGYNKNFNSLNTVGYKEIISFFDNNVSLPKAIELIKRNTRRYAKRQMTWFRRDKRIRWMNINSTEELEKLALKIQNSYNVM